mgnify:FL=1
MADIEKVMSVEDADIEKFMGIDRADIEKIMGVEMPSLVNAWQGDRGVFGGGYSGSAYVNVMDYISIASLGNSSDFGDLNNTMYYCRAESSGAGGRIVFYGGYGGSEIAQIDYITTASTGNAQDFGDTHGVAGSAHGASSNGTRGVFSSGVGGASGGSAQPWGYITFASTGDASAGGNLTAGSNAGGCGNASRALFAGGAQSGTLQNWIEYFNITSTDDGSDFGDLTGVRKSFDIATDGTTAIAVGGENASATLNSMDNMTVASAGNATDGGDLSSIRNRTATVEHNASCVFWGTTSSHANGQLDTLNIANNSTADSSYDRYAAAGGGGASGS